MLAEELAQVAASPPALVRAELDKVREGQPLPAVLEPLYDDPAGQLPAVAAGAGAVLAGGRRAGVAAGPRAAAPPTWPTGWSSSPTAAWPGCWGTCIPTSASADELLRVDKPHHCSHRFDLAGTGIVLVPCAFAWPSLSVDCCGVDQPALIYPPRGLAELWEDSRARAGRPPQRPGRPDPSQRCWPPWPCPGPPPSWPTQLDLSPPAVSQHLKILKDTALVTAHRRGRMVLYQRTPAATALLEAIRSHEETG